MATTNLNLAIVGSDEYVSPDPFNENFTKLDELGVDYITETGTSSDWFYRKYKSGRAECWAVKSMSDVSCTTAWGSLYRSGDVGNTSYPFSFSAPPHVTVSWQTTTSDIAFAVAWRNASESQTGSFALLRGTSGSTSGRLAIYASGMVS